MHCPQSVAAIDEHLLSQKSGELLRDIYADLGCPLNLILRPGKRGIYEFNKKKLDGEVTRLEIVEDHYTVPFVRSEEPLYYVGASLWGHPVQEIRDSLPTGYVRGIVWQEDYMKGRDGIIHDSYSDMYVAYERGDIGSFLSPDQIIKLEVDRNTFRYIPEHQQRFFEKPLYHYLQAEFAPFMWALSRYVDQHDSFGEFAPYPSGGQRLN